ncbi:AMP-binding protein [Pseudomonas sp. Sample_24]|uniref:AMP-binding protein n=1 Tax=Pseudomonas sp. Sample_24 TaxID=2448268 RepID=UPI0010327D93|nr:AMP-binding protein [Pseudomonas sp. Sample_24]
MGDFVYSAPSRIRLLALHGRGSNADISNLQLRNLGLSEDEFDICFMNGPIAVDKPGPGVETLGDRMTGPWYSWLPTYKSEPEANDLANAICDAILAVLSTVEKEGPFDGVFGFSQGGVIASLVNGLPEDTALLSALQRRSKGRQFSALQNGAPFRAAIIACAAASMPLSELRSKAGLGPAPCCNSKSVHLIGRHDENKAWSESLALSMNSTVTAIFYLASGHEINQSQRSDVELINHIRQCFLPVDQKSLTKPLTPKNVEWRQSSDRSFRVMARDVQLSAVKVETQGLSETFVEMLASPPSKAPFLRTARERNPNVYTTYGQVLEFCRPGGEGDLRRLGVLPGEVVAYLAPPGGTAVGAVAFLSIASQTCAAPLTPHMSKADALEALEQFGAKHVVLFGEPTASEVRAACVDFAAKNAAVRIHHAEHSESNSPGLFRYKASISEFQHLPILINSPMANCLLLRTSGTTSTPKVVPLRQRDMAWNAAILADGIGINGQDVAYSVMPLDHIGGLSASILCSVAVGASVTCEGLYNPQAMVEALMHSSPKPTWYSAVPTIHNATVRYLQEHAIHYLDQNGRWHGHDLRIIRSGAAELKEPDRLAIEQIYGCEVVATYSMSEQMPISQPARSQEGAPQSPGSVGVPVIASVAVVDPITFRPLPFGEAGEVAICGPTVCTGYLDNHEANQQSRFLLKSYEDEHLHYWFLTGDLGQLDADGTLSLRGRLKELIKRGGEQISPFEVESALTQHPWVNTAVCFPVPSDLYGEEVGCALVLESTISAQVTHHNAVKEMTAFLRTTGLARYKSPKYLKLVADEELPKTASRKYIRNGLAQVLQLPNANSAKQSPSVTDATTQRQSINRVESAHGGPKVDWETLAGFRFLLACYVMFMHIGSDESWGAFANLRQFPWHVHAFFVTAGFSLAIVMPSLINRKKSFVWARIKAMYPLYALALFFALINLLPHCQPSTFSPVFHWNSQPGDMGRMFCEGTPLLQESWAANLLATITIYLTGLSATPLWGASWFMGFYLWFTSMYFQCLLIFPSIYNLLYKLRKKTKPLLLLSLLGVSLNVLILLGFWYGYAKNATGYGFFDQSTGEKLIPSAQQMDSADTDNAVLLGFYLFSPFWMVYFVVGMCVAFLFDAVRPYNQARAYLWGYVADAITLLVVAVSTAHILQGYIPHGSAVSQASLDTFFLRPEAANNFADPGIVNRIWDEVASRLFAPITLLWLFALSTGQGLTAKILRSNAISQSLAPATYACFLFHQVVGQWYYAITRNGEWWNWWSYRKDFYWFSPQPVPVEWYEYFYLVGLVVIFGKLVQPCEPLIRRGFQSMSMLLAGNKVQTEHSSDTLSEVLKIIERTTGMEANPDLSLEECGLASLGAVQFASALRAEFSSETVKIELSVSDIISAADIRAIASIVDAARIQAQHHVTQVVSMS